MSITVGSTPLVVSSLGRIAAPGNTGVHSVKIVDAATNTDIPGAVSSINTSGATTGTFVYSLLPAPVTLNANTNYFVLSQETLGGDQWYNNDTATQTAADATLNGSAFGADAPFFPAGSSGFMYVPVDFKYVSIGVSPATAV